MKAVMDERVPAGAWVAMKGAGFCVGGLLVLILAGSARCLADPVPQPEFSHARGFYAEPFLLTIRGPDPGAIIRFTVDGSEPTIDMGEICTGAIPVTVTTCIRAVTLRSDGASSRIVTHTYLLGASEAVRSLPVLSLTGDEHGTFYQPNGICAIQGGEYTGNYVSWRPVRDDDYHYPLEHGWAFERAVSAELIFADGMPGFQVDCGIRVNGSTYTRSRYRVDSKFSFRLYFRSDYGCRRLDYPLIPEAPVAGFDRIVLRAGQSDATNPFVKDELGRRLQRDMSDIACLGSFVNLFINGRYRGYYNPTERIDEKMFQARFDSDEWWDVVTQWRPEDDAYGWQAGDPVDRPYRFDVRDGDSSSMNALLDYVLSHDLRVEAHYGQVAQRLDIPQFIDYLILEGYLNHRDWPHNNWTAARARCAGDLSKWRFYAWDLEHCFYTSDVDGSFKTPSSGGDVQPVGILYQQLLANDEFKRCFADGVQRHFFNGGALTAEHIVMRFEELRGTMAGVLANMDTSVRDTWAPRRPASVLDSLQSKGLFTIEGPRLFINAMPYQGQAVRDGDVLTLENPHSSGTVLFTLDGTDPRLAVTGEPTAGDLEAPEEDFSDAERGSVVYEYWLDIPGSRVSDLVDHPEFPVHPTGRESLSRFASPVRWADDYGARIYGYLYPAVTGDYTFWIASDNDGVLYLSVDSDPAHKQQIAHVSGWTSPQQWDKDASQQSAPVTLRAGARYYIEALYKEAAGGDHVAIAWRGPGRSREVIDGSYLGPAEIDWTVRPPSDGRSGGTVAPQAIEYAGEEIALGARTVLKARVLDDGLWSGLTEAVFSIGAFVFINEVMTDNVTTVVDPDEADEFPDWIELLNPTHTVVDLGGLYVTDDPQTPMKCRIPDGLTIGPSGFLLLWADGDPEQGPTHLPFKLDREGEAVGIYDARTAQWIDFVSVPSLLADQSWGRAPDDVDHWTINLHPSPGYSNVD